MLKYFYPKLYEVSIYNIDYKILFKEGIRFLIFDLDNTIVPHDIAEPDEKIKKFFLDLKEAGFVVCLLSNNSHKRVSLFNEQLGLYAVPRAGKPKMRGVFKALSLMGGELATAAIIGDQLFTDVWCGNRAGIYTILVKPVSERDEWIVRIKRVPEKFVLKQFFKIHKKHTTTK